MDNNSGLSTIADRYARALIELGESSDQLDKFDSDLFVVKATIESNPELNTFLSHPTITLEDKKDVIDSIFKNSIGQYTLNLLKLLLDRNRLFIFPAIANHYKDILNKKRNISLAQVITAIEIEDSIKDKVKTQLEKLVGKTIQLEAKVDPGIIAGMIIRVGDRIIDGSIKRKLEDMKRQLI